MFRKAIFKELGIRDCFVHLDRLVPPKKKLLLVEGKLRSQVSWLPKSSVVLSNSSEARAQLANFQEENDIGPTIGGKNILRQRAQSMLGNRTNGDGQLNGMKDHISELHTKFDSPNFGLKPSADRLLQPKPQQQQTDFEKLLDEFKQRVKSKLTTE